MDETDGLRDTGEREAAAGSIDEGYGEFSEFIDKSWKAVVGVLVDGRRLRPLAGTHRLSD